MGQLLAEVATMAIKKGMIEEILREPGVLSRRTAAVNPSWTRNGNPTFNEVPVGNAEKFMEIAQALSLTSFRLARFQVSYAAGHCGAAAASAIVAADPLQGAYSKCGGRAPDDDHRRRGGRRRRARYEVD